jgi:hypothetical protein
VIALLADAYGPFGLAVDQRTDTLYAANWDGTVSVIGH